MPKREPDRSHVKLPLDRRALLGKLAAAAGLGTAALYLGWAPEEWPASLRDVTGHRSQPRIKPRTIKDYRVAAPSGTSAVVVARGASAEERLAAALDGIGGLSHYVQPGDVVLVKPNVAFDRSPNLGATSNPEVVERLVRMLLVDCRAREVRVADNPIESPADCFAMSGVGAAATRAGGRVFLPDSNAFKVVETPGAELIASWLFFHRPFSNVDKVIGIAPVKDHNLCQASMGIKNWYGLLGGRRNQFHQDIHAIVSDLGLMMRPTLTILDGGSILMENGPTGGDPSNVKHGDAVVVGTDPVALDAWAFEHLLERGTDYPAYLARAEAKGVGRVDWHGRVRELA